MRLIVMFDLPTDTPQARHSYVKFRRGLIKNGFYMIQESVYTKMLLNQSVEESARQAVRKIKPTNGSVMMFSLTEKQFSKWECVVGEATTDVVDTDERLVIL